jgi:hypothetical protein
VALVEPAPAAEPAGDRLDISSSADTPNRPTTGDSSSLAEAAEPETDSTDGGDEQPHERIAIRVNGRDFSELRQEIQRAIALSNVGEPWLYLHGRDMAIAGNGELQLCDSLLLESRLADRIRFHDVKLSKEGMPVDTPANPPQRHIAAIHADACNIRLPEVDRVARAPFFGPDGVLQARPGYHADARTIYVPTPDVTIPEIPTTPPTEQVAAARHLILTELLGDFPFAQPQGQTQTDRDISDVLAEGDPDKIEALKNAIGAGELAAYQARTRQGPGQTVNPELAGAVALMTTPFVRPMIKGPTPLFGIDAPAAGTGKGLLMEILLTPSAGRSYTVSPAPTKPDEWAKQIVATLRPGPVAAIFDNANDRIDSGALASAVTAWPAWTSRLLGLSENVHMALPAVWCCNGKNIVASAENARRIVRVRLDAEMENPAERTGFRHSDLRQWALERQGEITAAILTLIQAWIAAGRPTAENLPKMGSFEAWLSIVGPILEYHGIKGLLTNRQALTDTLSDEGSEWDPMISLMVGKMAERADWTAVELVDAMEADSLTPPADLSGSTATAKGRKLGQALRARHDCRFGDHILRMHKRNGTARWKLDKVQ